MFDERYLVDFRGFLNFLLSIDDRSELMSVQLYSDHRRFDKIEPA